MPAPAARIFVSVDPNLCQGHGRCLESAPGAFVMDETEGLTSATSMDQPIDQLPQLRAAASRCPERAIVVEVRPGHSTHAEVEQ